MKIVTQAIRRALQISAVAAAALVLACTSGNGPSEDVPPVISGSVIEGIVREAATNAPMAFTRVSVTAPGTSRLALTDAGGGFSFTNIVPGTYTIGVDRAGYDTAGVDVPKGIHDTSFVDLRALRLATVPAAKPQGTGIYRMEGKVLHADLDGDGIYSLLRVKGAAFSPAPVGSSGGYSTAVMERSFLYLDSLHANTIRTYSGASAQLLSTAHAHGIRVIVGFWVDTQASMSDPGFRRSTVRAFREMVRSLRSYPAVLFWNLGNEQNLPHVNGDNPLWYDLAEELAVAAFLEEGSAYHPVCISNGDMTNIGDPAKRADDASLRYVDLWASNIYRLDLAPSFAQYRTRTAKPIVITEFGIDALDNRTRLEYEGVQMIVDSLNWAQITAASDVCIGGTVFEYTDEWWKAGDPLLHEYGGYATSQHPDGYSNEEWGGLIAVTPDINGDGMDEWRPRSVYRMFQRNWR